MPATLARPASFECARQTAELAESIELSGTLPFNVIAPARDRLVRHGCELYRSEQRRITIQRHLQASRRIVTLLEDASSGNNVDAGLLTELPRDYLPLLLRDRDSVLTCPFSPADERQQANRCLEVSLLAMAVGIELGFSESEVELLGTAGLAYDGRDALRRAGSLPIAVIPILRATAAIRRRIVPHGGLDRQIRTAAEILYAVEAYVRLRSPRPGRPALSPARALRRIVRGNGRPIDGAVPRALLRVLSLFPIGSRVQLSDGTIARVMRANADDFTCPVVQLLPDGDAEETQHTPLIDLAYSDLRIVRSLSD